MCVRERERQTDRPTEREREREGVGGGEKKGGWEDMHLFFTDTGAVEVEV